MRVGGRGHMLAAALILAMAAGAPATAAEVPVTVSPGSAASVAQVAVRCPTFSWTEAAAADHYEVVIYEVGEAEGESTAVLRQRVPGGATTWTPSLGLCLERGARYAWSVRAASVKAGSEGSGEWSAPSFFQVAAGPSEAEFEEALAVVRSYLDAPADPAAPPSDRPTETEAGPETTESSPGTAGVGTAQLSVDGGVVATSFTGDGSTLTALDPANLSAGSAGIDVTGTAANVTGTVALGNGGTGATDAAGARTNLGVVEGPHTVDTDTTCDGAACDGTSFTSVTAAVGDSATAFFTTGQVEEPRIADEIARDAELLAAIVVERHCRGAFGSTDRYTDCGNGTVRDNNTGLIWLTDASCSDLPGTSALGTGVFDTAQSAAAALADGTCGLTDGSQAGDWRVPTISEFCSAGAISQICPVENASDSLIDSSVGPPTVVNTQGTGVWMEGDAFVGVQTASYWSATEVSDTRAWAASLFTGSIADGLKISDLFIWPVRAGQ